MSKKQQLPPSGSLDLSDYCAAAVANFKAAGGYVQQIPRGCSSFTAIEEIAASKKLISGKIKEKARRISALLSCNSPEEIEHVILTTVCSPSCWYKYKTQRIDLRAHLKRHNVIIRKTYTKTGYEYYIKLPDQPYALMENRRRGS